MQDSIVVCWLLCCCWPCNSLGCSGVFGCCKSASSVLVLVCATSCLDWVSPYCCHMLRSMHTFIHVILRLGVL